MQKLALIHGGTILGAYTRDEWVDLPNGNRLCASSTGPCEGGYLLEAILPAAPIPDGYRSDYQSIELVDGVPQLVDLLVEITHEERRAAMLPLAKWRFNTIVDLETGLRDKINSVIAEMPEPQRTIARNKLADVQEYVRVDTLFDVLGAHPSIGKTPEDIDAMWAAGHALS